MNYSEEFKKEVKEIFPNNEKINELLENGGTFLGRYLDDARYGIGITVDGILSATTLEEVQARIINHRYKEEIYGKWLKLYEDSK